MRNSIILGTNMPNLRGVNSCGSVITDTPYQGAPNLGRITDHPYQGAQTLLHKMRQANMTKANVISFKAAFSTCEAGTRTRTRPRIRLEHLRLAEVDSVPDWPMPKSKKTAETVSHSNKARLRKSGRVSGDMIDDLAAGLDNDFSEMTTRKGRHPEQDKGHDQPPKRLKGFHGKEPDEDDEKKPNKVPLDDDGQRETQQIVPKLRKAEDCSDTLRIRLKGIKFASSILQESNGMKPAIILARVQWHQRKVVKKKRWPRNKVSQA